MKCVVLAEPETLAALVNPVVVDVRGADEIAKRAAAPGAINVPWNRDEETFYDPSLLPKDTSAAIVVN